MNRIFLCKTEAVAIDEVIQIELEGRRPLAVYNLNNVFYVTDDTCTHGDASLAEGEIFDGIIECPFHLGSFDIKSGAPAGAPCSIPIKTYTTTVVGEDIYIELAQ